MNSLKPFLILLALAFALPWVGLIVLSVRPDEIDRH